jgi:hypothetical protein
MADREHPHTSKLRMDEKSRRHMAGKGGQDALLKEREHGAKKGRHGRTRHTGPE